MKRRSGIRGVPSMSLAGRLNISAGFRSSRTVLARVLAELGLLFLGAAGCGPTELKMARPRIVETTGVRAIPTADARNAALFVSTPGPDSAPGKPPATPAAGRSASVVRVRVNAP